MTGSAWTCGGCGVTVKFMPGAVASAKPPSSWKLLNGTHYCLGCRRKLAGAEKAEALTDTDSPDKRHRAQAEGRIEFELGRAANHCDTRVARDCGTNVILVRQVRERLGAYPTQPV